ncbi:MAG: esterase-like activity of phytase family protein [Alphaproteobacteria bacterium]|nr:esterase-like activity of phytase family protein [Alphaproteobacteria bacterium]
MQRSNQPNPAPRPRAGNLSFRPAARVASLALLALTTVALAVAGAALAEPKPNPQKIGTRTIEVSARPITYFDRSNPTRTQFGQLTFIGGLKISSPEKSFGGWSGLALDADGRNFVAVSDAGLWMTGRLNYRKGRLAGLQPPRIGPLKALSGKPLRRERDRDAEAVELIGGSIANGKLLIAFEQNHRIGRFSIGKNGVSKPRSYVRPNKKYGKMSGLKGFEAMTVLTKGRYRGALMAIAERHHDTNGRHTGWIWSGKSAKRFFLTDIGGYDITGVATLPGGDLLLLERRFNWLEGIKMRLRRIPIKALKAGASLKGEILLSATMAQDIDNMEGLAVHRDERGRTIISILSDDNFNRFLQRTILLQFRLESASTSANAR